MKIASTSDGKEIAASNEAPKEALCPICKHSVTLRKRRLMNNQGFVYFWRHVSGGPLSCSARSGKIIRNGR
jgi:hypothetical protein